ncbi:hypothetical protein V5P93_004550 [Actinokineospora auranticolor]|uniref:Uncharacterized protein n=1 Tax=Actinokineospora auranticolor TaxID=155976 RepID=A0A2S6GSZ2_9PSEU|nr:hypothetical protein [Actinokineospora auranticolor]PPK68344.1 hypothetical protein CLV40_10567 [Actinokineospora auranticolor]
MLEGTWRALACADAPVNEACLAALPDGWLVFTGTALVAITGDGRRRVLARRKQPREREQPWSSARRPGLHTSRDGRFAALVTDYGARGLLFDLSTKSVTLELNRWDHHSRHTRFPLAFVGTGAETVVIAGTEWNRLDAFRAATGELLTDRETGQDHDADIFNSSFQGALSLNPSESLLLNDGWLWQPIGVHSVIDVRAWLGGDRTAADLDNHVGAYRDLWDTSTAWLDDSTAVVQADGHAEVLEFPGDEVTRRIPLPPGPLWSFGGRLHVAAAGGLEVWSPDERIGVLAGFHPSAQDPKTGTLASLRDGVLRTWRPDPRA